MNLTRVFVVSAIASLVAPTLVLAGYVRYDLPELVDEYRWEDKKLPADEGHASLDTRLPLADVSEARLVIEGRATAGVAHGDGVTLRSDGCDLLPGAFIELSGGEIRRIWRLQAPDGGFRFEQVHHAPFALAPVIAPGLDLNPPRMSVEVSVCTFPWWTTVYPPRLTPPGPGPYVINLVPDGIVVDVPIVVEVTAAHLVLSGPAIAPEPGGLTLLASGAVVLLLSHHRHRTAG